jgi:hypothetical protein
LVRPEQTECDKARCELYLFHTGILSGDWLV